jgi:hypothetical protein
VGVLSDAEVVLVAVLVGDAAWVVHACRVAGPA